MARHQTMYVVSALSYAQYRYLSNSQYGNHLQILDFIAIYLVASVVLFSVLPGEETNKFLVKGFFVAAIVYALPLYISSLLVFAILLGVYLMNKDAIDSELLAMVKILPLGRNV
ncbi:hypothetical protein PSDVSF_27640 [Pseudodesulfovibrio sediminis]|uniref:Uncharacterized protein n=2 Tax=Pseudodesulfovibrio sediminis TaxID=2810563 RepID=A0ABM8HXB1_9BACT|nr:hypothetical protein PSDVSF_27640 [Pseudodesulfovibrio sediminis]